MYYTVGKQTHDLTVIASDSKTTQSGGDNHKKFPLGAALQVPQNFSFALDINGSLPMVSLSLKHYIRLYAIHLNTQLQNICFAQMSTSKISICL
jgi:hypothetical protein